MHTERGNMIAHHTVCVICGIYYIPRYTLFKTVYTAINQLWCTSATIFLNTKPIERDKSIIHFGPSVQHGKIQPQPMLK